MRIGMLCGGVGGARAALALCENLPADSLTFLVNTGDDFRHLGLEIWPDWDTVVYTLGGLIETDRGWGRQDEGTKAMEEFSRLQAPDWFHLGDRDLALHVFRTWALEQGCPAHQVAAQIADRLGVKARVLRLTQSSLATEFVLKDGQRMDFQTWFVRHQGKPAVAQVKSGDGEAVTPGVLETIASSDLLLIAPSNPYLSILPMLGVPPVAEAVKSRQGPTWAVSPLLGGKAVKGPLDALLSELSPHARGQQAIVGVYSGWAQNLFLPADEMDGLNSADVVPRPCRTWLNTPQRRADFVADIMAAWKAL
jgi:LPPG:FO 2-phospho-L-lactate transferase